jgi:hypothetical protein
MAPSMPSRAELTYKVTTLRLRASKIQNSVEAEHFNAYIKENYTDNGNGHLNH